MRNFVRGLFVATVAIATLVACAAHGVPIIPGSGVPVVGQYQGETRPPAAQMLENTSGVLGATTDGRVTLGGEAILNAPRGTFAADRAYHLKLWSRPPEVLGSSDYQCRGVALEIKGLRLVTSRSQKAEVTIRLRDRSLRPGDEPVVRIETKDGSFDLLLQGPVVTVDHTVMVTVPSSAFAKASTAYLFAVRYAGRSLTALGKRELVADASGFRTWSRAGTIDPNKRTLLLLHGILSSVEDAFPDDSNCHSPGCGLASRLMVEGSYEQVIGYDYPWWDAPAIPAVDVATFVRSIGFNQSRASVEQGLDVIAHSYGTVIAMAAIPQFHVPVFNFITLGGPLDGDELDSDPGVFGKLLADLEEKGWLPDNASPDEIRRMSTSGMLDALVPGNPVIKAIDASFTRSQTARVFTVAGDKPYHLESLLLKGLGIPVPPGGYDGVVAYKDAFAAIKTSGHSPWWTVVPAALNRRVTDLSHTELEEDSPWEKIVPTMWYARGPHEAGGVASSVNAAVTLKGGAYWGWCNDLNTNVVFSMLEPILANAAPMANVDLNQDCSSASQPKSYTTVQSAFAGSGATTICAEELSNAASIVFATVTVLPDFATTPGPTPTPPTGASCGATTYNFTGAQQSFTVPSNVTDVTILAAAPGVSGTSQGAAVEATISVTPNEVLNVYVGGEPTGGSAYDLNLGGYNGGGNAGDPYEEGGAGASDVRRGGNDLAHRVIVAGGGGGGSYGDVGLGGSGGNPIGDSGFGACLPSSSTCVGGGAGGGGGTAGGGGAGGAGGSCGGSSGTQGSNGSPGTGGNGGTGPALPGSFGGGNGGGGGGGGYFGGGGGGGGSVNAVGPRCFAGWGGGGGGGSSYVEPFPIATYTPNTPGFGQAGSIIIAW